MATSLKCISCSIFKDEIEKLKEMHGDKLPYPFIYLDSMLHIYPKKLQAELDKTIAKNQKYLLIYGDCSPYMCTFHHNPDIKRIDCINCVEAFLGKENYKRMRKEGAFFLLPEWTRRWKEVFSYELGLSQDNLTSMMHEMHTKLVYVDTQLTPIPHDTLEEISHYIDLPYEIYTISLDHFLQSLLDKL